VAQQAQRALEGHRRLVAAERVVERLELVLERVALLGRAGVGDRVHPLADDVAGGEDAAGAADVEDVGEHVVVAGVDVEPVDRREAVVVGLLDRLDPVDLGQLGEQVVGQVERGALRDVVEDDRPVVEAAIAL
jgi:hypothetical protein